LCTSGHREIGSKLVGRDRHQLFGAERTNDDHASATLKLFGAYSIQAGPAAHAITARLDNATNEQCRSHLWLIKDLVPEMGRSFRLIYGVRF
jgi:hypothetical protein